MPIQGMDDDDVLQTRPEDSGSLQDNTDSRWKHVASLGLFA